MEYIKLNDTIYGYTVDFKDDKKIRSSFNSLTRKTYGFDFEKWYLGGYWTDRYITYALLDGEKVVSSVSVSIIDFLITGEKKKYIQIGTVMTDKEYRNKGLSRFIIEKILEEWEDRCDLIYLFANDSVLDFYPKFGFVSVDEYQYSKKIMVENTASNVNKLDMSDEEDRNFLVKAIKESRPVSKFHMCENESLIMFYCTSFMKENIYYIEALETIVIAEFDNDTIYLNDVFSIRDVVLDDIIKAMGTEVVKKIVLGFTPIDTDSYDVDLLREENTTLFVIGDKVDVFRDEKWMFPLLSHA